jgi:hypothetical protein
MSRSVRVSDLIKNLQRFQKQHGDLLMCVADTDCMVVPQKLTLEKVPVTKYGFTFGFDEKEYCNIKGYRT